MHSYRKKFCCNLFEVIPYIYWTKSENTHKRSGVRLNNKRLGQLNSAQIMFIVGVKRAFQECSTYHDRVKSSAAIGELEPGPLDHKSNALDCMSELSRPLNSQYR